MGMSYEEDIVAWSAEQAALLRDGKLSALDVKHIAEQIESVGKSEQRELAQRMTSLLSCLLKWEHQPERRGANWASTIRAWRNSIARRVRQTPSLEASLGDPDWWADAWDAAVDVAVKDIGRVYTAFPATCPWSPAEVLDLEFLPGALHGEDPANA